MISNIKDVIDWINNTECFISLYKNFEDQYSFRVFYPDKVLSLNEVGLCSNRKLYFEFFKDAVYINPNGITFNVYYRDEPLVLDLFTLLSENVETRDFDYIDKTKQNIILRLL